MKRILSEDTALVDSHKHAGGMPETKIFLPNYKGVNQVLTEAPGSAEISFSNVLSKSSMKMLRTQEKTYQGLERDTLLSDVGAKHSQALTEFINANPSGRGLTAFATSTYSNLIKEASGKAQSPEVAQQIKTIGAVNFKGIANSAVNQENKQFVAYSMYETEKLLSSKYNEIQKNPDLFEGKSIEATQILNNLDGVVPASAFLKFQDAAKDNLFMSYGLGLIQKKPQVASEILKNDLFAKNLSHDNFTKLNRLAELTVQESIRKEKYLAREMERQKVQDSWLKLQQIQVNVAEYDSPAIFADESLTERDKQKAISLRYQYEEKARTQQEWSDRCSAAKEGLDNINIVPVTAQQEDFKQSVIMMDARFDGENQLTGGNRQVTLMDKAQMMKSYSFTNKDLNKEIVSNLEQSESINDTVNASFALAYLLDNCPQRIGSVSSKHSVFAREVVSELSVNPKNKEEIVERLRERYLRKDSPDVREISALHRKYMNEIPLKAFVDGLDFGYKIFGYKFYTPNFQIENIPQFQKDMSNAIYDAVQGGARGVLQVKEQAILNMKAKWKNLGDKIQRNSPEVVLSHLGDTARRNIIARNVKAVVSKLDGKEFAGTKFSLHDEIFVTPKKHSDMYNINLCTSDVPKIDIEINSIKHTFPVELESVAMKRGMYMLYIHLPDGSKIYLPSATNPTLRAGIQLDEGE